MSMLKKMIYLKTTGSTKVDFQKSKRKVHNIMKFEEVEMSTKVEAPSSNIVLSMKKMKEGCLLFSFMKK